MAYAHDLSVKTKRFQKLQRRRSIVHIWNFVGTFCDTHFFLTVLPRPFCLWRVLCRRLLLQHVVCTALGPAYSQLGHSWAQRQGIHFVLPLLACTASEICVNHCSIQFHVFFLRKQNPRRVTVPGLCAMCTHPFQSIEVEHDPKAKPHWVLC